MKSHAGKAKKSKSSKKEKRSSASHSKNAKLPFEDEHWMSDYDEELESPSPNGGYYKKPEQ